MHIGMRTIKTALSVMICIGMVNLLEHFGINYFTGFFAGLAAVNAMQSSISETRAFGIARAYGTFLGSLIGIAMYPINEMIFQGRFETLFAGLGIIITINIVSRINQQAVFMACALFIASITNKDSFFIYMAVRTLETAFGAFTSIAINELIRPPKHK